MAASSEQVFLGRYQAVRHINDGGMARVWLARDTDSDRLVVVSRLLPQYLSKPAMRVLASRTRFDEEVPASFFRRALRSEPDRTRQAPAW